MKVFLSLWVLFVSALAFGDGTKWSYKITPGNPNSTMVLLKNNQPYTLDQKNWAQVSVAMNDYARFMTPEQTAAFNKRIDGDLKQFDKFGWQEVLKTPTAKSPNVVNIFSPKQSELSSLGDFLVASLGNVDDARFTQLQAHRRSCTDDQDDTANKDTMRNMYTALATVAAMKGCEVKKLTVDKGELTRSVVIGPRPDYSKCTVTIPTQVYSRAGNIQFESTSGSKLKLTYSSHIKVLTTDEWLNGNDAHKGFISQLQEQGYCKINSKDYSATPAGSAAINQ